jgi:hypothetical protein
MVDIVRELDVLGFDDYPDEVEAMLSQVNWDDKLNKLRVGVVLTFSLYEQRNEQYVSYVVDELSTGAPVFLIRPAWLNKGYDFKVCVEGWDESANPAPSHSEVYSDLYWKREHDSSEAFEAICAAVKDIHNGAAPNEVLSEYSGEFDFSVGRRPEALLKPLPWLFIEQDIRYWNYTGRNMTIGLVDRLCEGVPLEEIDLDLQDVGAIHETPLANPSISDY